MYNGLRSGSYPMFSLSKYISLYIVAFGPLMLLMSCSLSGDKGVPTYAVTRTSYEDMLVIEGYTEPVNSLNILCPPQVKGTVVWIVENGTEVKKGDVVCVLEDMGIIESCERLTLDLESAYAELEKLQASHQLEYALLEAQVKNNEAEAILAASDSLQMLYMSPMERRTRELQLERANIERDRLIKKMEAAKVMQEMDMVRAEKRIIRIERRLDDERKKLESFTLRAPKDGIAVRGKQWPWSDVAWNVGDQVWEGRIVVTLPDFEQLKVLFYAQETEYKRLHLGDSVMYTFDAMPDNIGWGRITKLSPVGQTRTEGSAVKTFEIEATVDSLLSPVDPGLSVQCRVFLRYVPDTIVVPTISIFDRDSMKVVYVEHAGRYEERLVTLGEGSPRSTIISKGLKPGERIALVKPKND